jgi:SAM-dependent methyltransferase
MIARGWDNYARQWQPDRFRVVDGHRVHYLGDEWTAEDESSGGTTYGLPPGSIENFDEYLDAHLLAAYLPAHAARGLEIGPGGGRVTRLLLPRTTVLHVADPSEAMLAHLLRRFGQSPQLRVHHIDGRRLPPLDESSLDFIVAFDVFVHFEPRLVYWYLRQIAALLNDGGVAIIHYANVLAPIGWRQFLRDLEPNLQGRSNFAAFGVMCPALMGRFLTSLPVEVVSLDTQVIPRDAVTVFRKRGPASAS